MAENNAVVGITNTTHRATFHWSKIVRDIVIGMSDGLTVPFALAAGLSGAIDSTRISVTAGLAEIRRFNRHGTRRDMGSLVSSVYQRPLEARHLDSVWQRQGNC